MPSRTDDRDDDEEDDREQSERPRPRGRRDEERPSGRRKGGMPAWGWVLIGVGLLLVLGCSGGLAVWLVGKDGGLATKGQAMANAKTIQVNSEHRIGDIGITITGCNDRWMECTSTLGERFNSANFTVVDVTIKNYNPNRLARVGSQVGVAKAIDDRQTELASMVEISSRHPLADAEGRIRKHDEIALRSDEVAKDVIVFERVVPAVKRVTVYLDATAYGGTGYLKADLIIENKKSIK